MCELKESHQIEIEKLEGRVEQQQLRIEQLKANLNIQR